MPKKIRIDAASLGQLQDMLSGVDADLRYRPVASERQDRYSVVTKLGRLGFAMAATMLLLPANAPAQTSPPAVNPFIIPGKPIVNISQAHWQVALVDGNDSLIAFVCGGSLVAPNWVLTAAHCVDNFAVQRDPKRLDVIAGTSRYKTGGQRTDVDKIFVHPNWNAARFDFDAALLKLKTPVTLVQPIKLIAPTGALPEGPTVRVTGWRENSQGGSPSEMLHAVDVPVISNAECNKPESYDGRVTAQMFCAGEGDGGGPVMSEISDTKELVGIVSWGFGCALALKYGVYTRVTTISQWAADTIAGK